VQFRNLVIGIKRKLHRRQDNQAQKADAIFRAQRESALRRSNYRCVFCGAKSETNEVHHLDDNHHNNSPENLVAICKLCHPYHHIGQASSDGQEKGLNEGHIGAKNIALIRVPDNQAIPARDLNHLQRAIAIALCDENESKEAMAVFNLLAAEFNRRDLVHAFFGEDAKNAQGELMRRVQPNDVAAALAHLTDDEYARREPVLGVVRVLYRPDKLLQWGRGWKKEQRGLSDPSQWGMLLKQPMDKVLPPVAASASTDEAVSVSAVLSDDDTAYDSGE